MLNELDRSPLGPADQLFKPSLALDQRQVAQVLNLICDYGLEDKSIPQIALAAAMFGLRSQAAPDIFQVCSFLGPRLTRGPFFCVIRDAKKIVTLAQRDTFLILLN
jgi:hypothetical protein